MSTGKVLAYLEHLCPECSTTFSSPISLLNHLKSSHMIHLSPRKAGRNRPTNASYVYVKNQEDAQTTQSACPSCWSHFNIDDVHELSDHIRTVHLENSEQYMQKATNNQQRNLPEGVEEYIPPKSSKTMTMLSGSKKTMNEKDTEAVYLKRSNELLNTLEDMVANFKKLLPYGGSTDKDNRNSSA
jgi:hypothetical protein